MRTEDEIIKIAKSNLIKGEFADNDAAIAAGLDYGDIYSLPLADGKAPLQVVKPVLVQFGYVSDLHASSLSNNVELDRYRLDAHEKLSVAVADFNSRSLDFVIMNGDIIDRGDTDKSATIADLISIDALFQTINTTKYYSFGNHDLDNISKSEFIANTGMSYAYYSFDKKGIHFIVLDSCYSNHTDGSPYDSGNFNYQNTAINDTQKAWLQDELDNTVLPCVIFLHNQLDEVYAYPVVNRTDIRTMLENSGKVKSVIQGHIHMNAKSTINGITYYSMDAMCMFPYPENSYGIVTVNTDGSISVEGIGNQSNY